MMLPFILYPTPNKRDLLRERGKTGKQFYFSSPLLPCSIPRKWKCRVEKGVSISATIMWPRQMAGCVCRLTEPEMGRTSNC